MADLAFRRPFLIRSGGPLISFTFDDFPRSALLTGGAILQRFGLAGTYYAALSLTGTQAPTGPIFEREDLQQVLAQGHELGCHTFAHCDAWETRPPVFEASIIDNQRALQELCPGATFRTLSYPINPPRPRTKGKVARYYECCRSGGQTFNTGTIDLSNLRAYFVDAGRDNQDTIQELIEENRRAQGWLIFATHDVCPAPTRFGCTPDLFEWIVSRASSSGARVLPVIKALEVLRSSRH